MTTRRCITAMPIREPAGWYGYNEGRLVINGSHPVILLRLVADVTRVVTFGGLGHHVDALHMEGIVDDVEIHLRYRLALLFQALQRVGLGLHINMYLLL